MHAHDRSTLIEPRHRLLHLVHGKFGFLSKVSVGCVCVSALAVEQAAEHPGEADASGLMAEGCEHRRSPLHHRRCPPARRLPRQRVARRIDVGEMAANGRETHARRPSRAIARRPRGRYDSAASAVEFGIPGRAVCDHRSGLSVFCGNDHAASDAFGCFGARAAGFGGCGCDRDARARSQHSSCSSST